MATQRLVCGPSMVSIGSFPPAFQRQATHTSSPSIPSVSRRDELRMSCFHYTAEGLRPSTTCAPSPPYRRLSIIFGCIRFSWMRLNQESGAQTGIVCKPNGNWRGQTKHIQVQTEIVHSIWQIVRARWKLFSPNRKCAVQTTLNGSAESE